MSLLAACGFKPQYASDASSAGATVDLSAVAVSVSGATATVNAASTITGRSTEMLKAEIEDQINPRREKGQKQFLLAIAFTEQDSALFVNPDGTSSRGDLIYASNYNVTRIADGKAMASGNIQRSSSYSASPKADYASYVSVEDARKKGILALAQDYKLRLAVLLPTLNHPEGVSGAAAPSAPPVAPRLPALPLQSAPVYETLPPR